MPDVNKESLLARLEPFGQQPLLRFWDELDEGRRTRLAAQIEDLDLPLVRRLFSGGDTGPDWSELAARAAPPRAVRLDGSGSPHSRDDARRRGEQALRAGQVGMVLVAGGQGSRLGFEHPKGMFPIGPVSNRTLFQVLIDLLLAVRERYQAAIPLYIMTSPATHDETVEYLGRHDRFGLPEEDVRYFCQGVMPAVDDASGEILLAERGSLALSPDGHGGMLAALGKSGCLDDLRRRGIERLFYGQIDNPLIQLCDPEMLGYHLLAESELTTHVVAKIDPLERVGNVVTLDGQLRIIEYSDLPESAARRTDAHGHLELWAGNLAVHIFDVAFLERMLGREDALPFHRAHKKAPHVDQQGNLVEPETPNAVKFERFIFDLLPMAANALAVEGAKQEAFAPVKNADGAPSDTPASAKQLMIDQHTRWLRAAGAEVDDGVPVEINPRFALDPGELADKLPHGRRISQPTYFDAE
ncbi:MAG: UDPGP type 1 family protein [Pirellulaceae bacterium]